MEFGQGFTYSTYTGKAFDAPSTVSTPVGASDPEVSAEAEKV
jgi:hypothetical protein